MRGHVRRRGSGWAWVVDAGRFAAQRCEACSQPRESGRRGPGLFWVEKGKPREKCPRCSGALGEAHDARRQAWSTIHPRKADAEADLRTFLERVKAGADPYPENVSLRDYAARWMARKTELRPATRHRYIALLDIYVLPRIGSVPVAKIRAGHVQDVVDAVVAAGRSPSTAVHVFRVLGSVLRSAVKGQLIPVNPADGAQPPTAGRPQLQVPNGHQLAALIQAAVGTRWEIPVLLACTTGARRSEVLGLTWSNVDLERGHVRIVRGIQRVPTDAVTAGRAWAVPGQDGDRTVLAFLNTKSKKSARTVRLPAIAIERLRRHRAEQAQRRLAAGPAWVHADLLCERGDGGPCEPNDFSNAFRAIAKTAGLPPGVRLHDTRHGVATALLADGVHPAIASAVLGHSSTAFTMDVYQHLLDGMTGVAADAMDRALGSAAGSTRP